MIEKLDGDMQTVFSLNDIENVCFGKDAWSVRNLLSEFGNKFSHMYGAYEGKNLVG